MISNPVGILRYKVLSERGRAVAAVWNILCGTVGAHEPPNAPQTQSQVLSYLLTFCPKSPAGISFYFAHIRLDTCKFSALAALSFRSNRSISKTPSFDPSSLPRLQELPSWQIGQMLKLSRWDAFNLCHQVPLPGAQATWKLGEKRWWGCCRWSP